ncbi:hypothetical protein Csa_000417 [Cucumis sativus]|uniref:Uncharacterized protein n=1 Tax=Cucumis sativus TaxID=3659 RepID=A0A0A0KL54_CUCSA|nr:hypothetical protein Csa_000417 [Cucumis sativus]
MNKMASYKKHLIILATLLYLMLFLSTYGAARILDLNGSMKVREIKVIVVGRRIVRRDLAHGGNYGPGVQ